MTDGCIQDNIQSEAWRKRMLAHALHRTGHTAKPDLPQAACELSLRQDTGERSIPSQWQPASVMALKRAGTKSNAAGTRLWSSTTVHRFADMSTKCSSILRIRGFRSLPSIKVDVLLVALLQVIQGRDGLSRARVWLKRASATAKTSEIDCVHDFGSWGSTCTAWRVTTDSRFWHSQR